MQKKTKADIFRTFSYVILIGAFTVAFIYLLIYGQRNAEQLEFVKSQVEYSLIQSALLKTSEGYISIDLDSGSAPISVYSFIALSKNGFYNDSVFSNSVTDYYIEGGKRGSGSATSSSNVSRHLGETYKESNAEVAPVRGDVLLINSGLYKKDYRFLIVTSDNLPLLESLKGKFPKVGVVTTGMDVVERIEKSSRGKKATSIKEIKVLE